MTKHKPRQSRRQQRLPPVQPAAKRAPTVRAASPGRRWPVPPMLALQAALLDADADVSGTWPHTTLGDEQYRDLMAFVAWRVLLPKALEPYQRAPHQAWQAFQPERRGCLLPSKAVPMRPQAVRLREALPWLASANCWRTQDTRWCLRLSQSKPCRDDWMQAAERFSAGDRDLQRSIADSAPLRMGGSLVHVHRLVCWLYHPRPPGTPLYGQLHGCNLAIHRCSKKPQCLSQHCLKWGTSEQNNAKNKNVVRPRKVKLLRHLGRWCPPDWRH